jgi:hypothetical protein
MKIKASNARTKGRAMFTVVPSTSRKYGHSIKAPADVTWTKGPGKTFGLYKRKRDAQQRYDELNKGKNGRTTEQE